MPVYKDTPNNRKLGRVGKEYSMKGNPGNKKGEGKGGAPAGNTNAVKDASLKGGGEVYKDTPNNRKLNRVGKPFGSMKTTPTVAPKPKVPYKPKPKPTPKPPKVKKPLGNPAFKKNPVGNDPITNIQEAWERLLKIDDVRSLQNMFTPGGKGGGKLKVPQTVKTLYEEGDKNMLMPTSFVKEQVLPNRPGSEEYLTLKSLFKIILLGLALGNKWDEIEFNIYKEGGKVVGELS